VTEHYISSRRLNHTTLKTHLNAPLLLEGVLKVALVDVDIVSSTSKTEAI
jgi:hypothetical protein